MPNSVSADYYASLASRVAAMNTNGSSGSGQADGRSVMNSHNVQRLQAGGSESSYNHGKQMAFCRALMQRGSITCAAQVQQYLAEGASLKQPVTQGVFRDYYPLHFASFFGDEPAVKAMLAAKQCNINARSGFFTALDMACGAGLAKALQSRQAVTGEPSIGERCETVKTLLEAKAKLHEAQAKEKRGANGGNPHCDGESSGNVNRVSKVKTVALLTPLHHAARNGFHQLIKPLVDSGFSVNARQKKYGTPIHSAASGNQYESVKILIELGASVNETNSLEQTPLHCLALAWGENEDSTKIAELLLEAGVNHRLLDKKTKKKRSGTAAEHAASLGKRELLEKVILSCELHKFEKEYLLKSGNSVKNNKEQFVTRLNAILDLIPDTVMSLQQLCKRVIRHSVDGTNPETFRGSISSLPLPKAVKREFLEPIRW